MTTNSVHDITKQLNKENLDAARVLQLAKELDISDSNSILNFGADAQRKVTGIADSMLADSTAEEAGKAGELLTNMVRLLRGFRGTELKAEEKPSFFARLFNKSNPLENFLEQFDSVSDQIDNISNALEQHKQKLLIDIKSLDKLYDANLEYYHELEHYIAAAEEVIRRTDEEVLPALKDKAEYGDNMETIQRLQDCQMQQKELEHRLHDLRLTKQVAIQALPGIRMVQANNKGLVSKINSTLINTVPLWRQQLAQSIAVFRSGAAAQALKQSNDLTNELLIANAETLKNANKESKEQIERGVFDIHAIEQANQMLIATIEESIAIHENGRKEREEAVAKLQAAEDALKNSLLRSSAAQGNRR